MFDEKANKIINVGTINLSTRQQFSRSFTYSTLRPLFYAVK